MQVKFPNYYDFRRFSSRIIINSASLVLELEMRDEKRGESFESLMSLKPEDRGDER